MSYVTKQKIVLPVKIVIGRITIESNIKEYMEPVAPYMDNILLSLENGVDVSIYEKNAQEIVSAEIHHAINEQIRKEREKDRITYAGTRQQVEKQLACEHDWSGPCISISSRYHKCKKCWCVMEEENDQEEKHT